MRDQEKKGQGKRRIGKYRRTVVSFNTIFYQIIPLMNLERQTKEKGMRKGNGI